MILSRPALIRYQKPRESIMRRDDLAPGGYVGLAAMTLWGWILIGCMVWLFC